MWGLDVEAPRIIGLRRATNQALLENGPFKFDIRLRIGLFLSEQDFNDINIGDLDNFISGICDALQAAPPNANIHESFADPRNHDVKPSLQVGIVNDRFVLSIVADRYRVQNKSHYTVVLDGSR